MTISPFKTNRPSSQRGFTLIELLTAITILILLLLMVFSMVDQTQRTYVRASEEANQFREARLAFESISRRLRQATLNTYWDYKFGSNQRPTEYIRQSELHFVMGETSRIAQRPATVYPGHAVFFQAPFGYVIEKEFRQFTELVNAWGFFVEFGDDRETLPAFLRGRVSPDPRYRLKEFRLPSEEFEIYETADERRDSQSSNDNKWFSQYMGGGAKSLAFKRTVAENVLTLVLLPQKATPRQGAASNDIYYQTGYSYDSRNGLGEDLAEGTKEDNLHLLPSLIRVTLIAIDEKTARREETGSNPPGLIPSGLFKQPRSLERDLRLIEDDFNDRKINHRIFSTTVALREAGWIRRDARDDV